MNVEVGQKREVEKQEPVKRVVFVLSGRANRGAPEVGVLLALLRQRGLI